MKRVTKRRIGILFWIAAAAMLVYVSRSGTDQSSVTNEIENPDVEDGNPWDLEPAADTVPAWLAYLTTPQERHEIADPVGRLQRFDPIFLKDDAGDVRQVGHVTDISRSESGHHTLHFAWYDNVPADECQLLQYYSDGSLAEVVQTILPPEKKLQIKQRLAAAMANHGEDLSRAFVPLVRESLKRSLPVIEEEFRKSVARHRAEIDELGSEWKDEIIEERLIPLARKELLPIVRKHGQPPAERIGKEMWDRASLWRFGWRALYDKAPLPQKNLVQSEWKRFVKKEAIPVIESHMDEIVVSIQRTLTDIAKNKRVRQELVDVGDELAADPKTRALVRNVLRETLIENERLRKTWESVWSSDDARSAMNMAGDRLEPIVRSIGDDLFGTPEQGIDPNFARVLRTQILKKDRRWIMAWHTGLSNGEIPKATRWMSYPLVYIAKEAR